VVWSSATPSVATLGTLTTTQNVNCLTAGTSLIKATFSSIVGQTTITCVTPVPTLVSITVTPTSPSINVGASLGFTATGTYSDNTTKDLTATSAWLSTATSIASLGTLGTQQSVTCLAAGTSNIRATFAAVSGQSTLTCSTATPPTLVSISVTPKTPTITVGSTLNFLGTGTYSDNSTQNVTSLGTWSSSNTAIATVQLTDCVVGVACSKTLTGTGSTPYTWTVPATAAPNGAVDMLDWALMPLPDRNNFCMTGGATPKCSVQNGGMFWWVKSFSGWAADMQLYDGNFVYEYATENNDASQQAACQAAGFSSCFLDPFAYKMAVNLSPAFPRYFVPGSTVTLRTPSVLQAGSQVNPFIRTTNCGADNQPLVYLGNKKFVTTGPFTDIDFGGVVGQIPYIENDYYYSGDVNGVYVNLEKRFFAKPYGWVRFELWQLVGGVYVFQSGSTNNIKTAHAAVTPNFGCGVPPLPQSGVLPLGTKLTASPSLNLKDSTGVISGTPATSGTYPFTVQQEDAAGVFHLQSKTIRVDASASAAQETVTCVAAGTATITETIGGVVGSTSITCTNPAPTLQSISVTPKTPSIAAGTSIGMLATGTFSDKSTQD
jgi:hypothetical protein